MKTIVINLARAAGRRARITAQLNVLGAPFSFLDATDGKDLSRFDRSFVDHDARKAISKFPLSDGEIGCWHSHRRIMVDIAMNGPDMVAVLEDDVTVDRDFRRVLAALEQSRVAFDFVDLHRVFRPSQTFVPHSALCEDFSIGWLRYTQMSTTGYVIRREGAIKFLQAVPRFSHAIDKAMKRWWSNGLNYLVLDKPVVGVPRGGPSQIDDEGRAQRSPYDDAFDWSWQAARFAHRALDSVNKRRHFSALMNRTRALLPEADSADHAANGARQQAAQ